MSDIQYEPRAKESDIGLLLAGAFFLTLAVNTVFPKSKAEPAAQLKCGEQIVSAVAKAGCKK